MKYGVYVGDQTLQEQTLQVHLLLGVRMAICVGGELEEPLNLQVDMDSFASRRVSTRREKLRHNSSITLTGKQQPGY